MKIGYPCINRSIGCTANSTFRLKNYSRQNLINKLENNLNCLLEILKFNLKNDLMFFRISSDLVPFASHPVCKFKWWKYFQDYLKEIGIFINQHQFRISMHPDQFVILNSPRSDVLDRSIDELNYHARVLDALQLDKTAKIQIHVGGVYQQKDLAIRRFIKNYEKLPPNIKNRLVIENDDRSYCVHDCIFIHQQTGIPVVFDNLHHFCLHQGETMISAFSRCSSTWDKSDGVIITDYSEQNLSGKRCSHAQSITPRKFKKYLAQVSSYNPDIMLEIKDKEISGIKAVKILHNLLAEI
ncbi:MAG: UV DNA damage repair endonuclease UvsE [bacterium]